MDALRHFGRTSFRKMLQFLASKAVREVASVFTIPCCLRVFEDMQHVHIPAIFHWFTVMMFIDFHMGNLFSPDSGSYWEGCWGLTCIGKGASVAGCCCQMCVVVCALEPECWYRFTLPLTSGSSNLKRQWPQHGRLCVHSHMDVEAATGIEAPEQTHD